MFVSYTFVISIGVLLLLYYLIPKKLQWIFLLIASFLFYISAGLIYPIFLFITAVTIYMTAMIIWNYDKKLGEYIKTASAREEKRAYKKKINNKKKTCMLICLLFNLGILAVVKYTNFVIENVNTLLRITGKAGFDYIRLIVPLGISFYTFQAVGYLLDVYWGKVQPQKNFFRFLLFISFFPQLIQGPISRYCDLSQTLYKEHYFNWKKVHFGLERILWGYFKKLVVADRIGTAVAMIMSDPDYYTGAFVFVGMLFYAVQLYADFTGGIDITIGIAQALGIHMQENFIRPYFSKSIAEYWRRWHISMGTWFRDYVFYPISISSSLKKLTTWTREHIGSKTARRAAVYISTMFCWLATGIWHGAEWHFVVWGLVNGVIILTSQECVPLYQKFHERFPNLSDSRYYQGFQVIRTFFLMCCIRLFDNYGNVKVTCVQYINMIVKWNFGQLTAEEFLGLGLSATDYIIVSLGILLMFLVSLAGRQKSVREQISQKPYSIRYSAFVLLFFIVILFGKYGVGFDTQQFIYNQF